MESDTDDGDSAGRSVYRVPLEAVGRVTVEADDPEHAVAEARRVATTGDVTLIWDASLATQVQERERDSLEVGETVANRTDGDGASVQVPTVPSPRRFRQVREELGASQRAVADALGVSRSTVGSWERGDTSPTVDQARRWALALARLRDQS